MNYLEFCKRCIRGEIPYQKKFYVLDKRYDTLNDNKDKNLDVTVVTPTQQAVEQAKQELTINSGKKRKFEQTGGKGNEIKNKKRKNKKEKQKENRKKGIRKKIEINAKERRRPKISSSYKAIWM